MTATPTLDHIVILVPHKQLSELPAWTKGFIVSPGGRHGDGKTENKLIIFADGTYLELIAFVGDNPAHREGHWWGNKGEGIIDYAFTLKEGHTGFEEIRSRLEAVKDLPRDWIPKPLKGGSRNNADGEKIEWQVSFPEAKARGAAPFWCFDVTPRSRRVPISDATTAHPNGVRGIVDFAIHVQDDESAGLLRRYLSEIPLKQADAPTSPDSSASFELDINSSSPVKRNYLSLRKSRTNPLFDTGRLLIVNLVLGFEKCEGDAPEKPKNALPEIDITYEVL